MNNETKSLQDIDVFKPTDFPKLQDEYFVAIDLPPTSPLEFSLGISKGELGKASLSFLERSGWQLPENFYNRSYSYESNGNKLFRLSSEDLIKLTVAQVLDFAVIGADKILEAKFRNIPIVPITPLNFKPCRLCVEMLDQTISIQPIAETLQSGTLILSEKLEMVSKYFIRKRYGFEPKNVIVLDGSLEASPALFCRIVKNPIVIDIVDSGETARTNGLKILDVVTNIPGAYLVTNINTLNRLKNMKGYDK